MPVRQRNLQGSYEEGPSGGLSLLAEAAGTLAPLGVPNLWSQSIPQVSVGLLYSRSFQTFSGPPQPPISFHIDRLPCRRTFLNNCKASTSAFKPISEQTLDSQATVRMTQQYGTILDDDEEIGLILIRPPLLPYPPMAIRGLPRLSRLPTPKFNFDWPQRYNHANLHSQLNQTDHIHTQPLAANLPPRMLRMIRQSQSYARAGN